MALGLEETLRSLHSLLDTNTLQSNKELIEVNVEDIRNICLQNILDLDYACSLLLDADTGILSFLRKILTSDEVQSAKASALALLSDLLQKVGRKIIPYAVDIKETCLSVYSRDRFAKVKNAAISVIIKILELTASTTKAQDLKLESLIEKFFNELALPPSKLAATVKAVIYHLLGVLAELYPELMTDYSEKLASVYVRTLQLEMTSKNKKPEMSVVAGCLEGLNCFMLNFTQSVEEESKNAYEIFRLVQIAINPDIDYARYDAPRAALKLLARHASQFRQLLMDDYEVMYHKLEKWSRHSNRELLHLGVAALEAFTKEVSETLVERAKKGQKNVAIFKFFVLKFNSIMKDQNASSKDVAMAIKGYGLLAAPCRIFLTEADTQFMLSEMIGRCEHRFLSKVESIDEVLMSMPSYLTSLASIIQQVDSVSIPNTLVLERLMVLLIENIPQVNSSSQQFHCAKSVLVLLLVLMRKPTVFQQILASVVYQSLIRTCSHPVVAETSQLEDIADETLKVSYKNYVSLWKTLLESSQIKDLAAEDFTLKERDQLTSLLYDELMSAILKILSKLNLETTLPENSMEIFPELEKERDNLSADPIFGLVANRPKDHQILINIVDFSKDLLLQCQWQRFRNWVHTFTCSAIVLSTKYPLVSGFYKILSTVMLIACKLKYFKNVDGVGSSQSSESMEVDEACLKENLVDKHQAYQLIKKFSKEVLIRVKQYRDELLAACLSLILALPEEVIKGQLADVVPAIQSCFIIGLSYLPLANIGLDALQYWSSNLPPSLIEPHYPKILPYLDAYLRTEDKGSDEATVESAVLASSKKAKVKPKVSVRLIKGKPTLDMSSESQLTCIKLRILQYLGSLGGHINHALLAKSDEEISSVAIAWDTEKHLKFDMPFIDMKPSIYLDPFLPQVVKLAGQSSDRQTKVAACELLHALVLYTLGRGAQLPGDTKQKYPMEKLYRKLFPALLGLACDVEQVCKELFDPLMLQLIHWFTNNKMAESPETMALLDCIFDGLIQSSDMTLRDFSAKCLREFLKWSLKQISKKAAEKNPVNAKSLLKRIFSFSSHPNSCKRLGAALAFNNIYMVFREEDALVNRFTFEILVHFVESLSLAHQDDKSVGTQEQCVKVLEHLEKIIKKKVDILIKDPGPKDRPEPSAWNGRKLEFAVRWLTRQCGNPQTECRHACMKLVYNLCVLLPGVTTQRVFFSKLYEAEGPSYFIRRFEGGGQVSSESQGAEGIGHTSRKSNGILTYPTMTSFKDSFSLDVAKEWFDLLLAALDGYCWLFGEQLLTLSQIFKGEHSETSKLFVSLSFFLDSLAFTDIAGAAVLFTDSRASVFTPREHEEYNRLKCTVIVRIWNFITALVSKHAKELKEVVPLWLWSDKLWRLLCYCVVKPTMLGFNMSDTEIMLNLPKEMKTCLQMLTKYLPDNLMSQFSSILRLELAGECNLISLLPITLTSQSNDCIMLTQLLDGYQQLHEVHLLFDHLPKLGKCRGISLPEQLLENAFESIIQRQEDKVICTTLSPSALTLAKRLLTLALELDVSFSCLVDKLLNKTMVKGFSGGVEVSHGDYFFTLSGPSIAASIPHQVQEVVEEIFKRRTPLEPSCVGSLLLAVLDHVAKDRNLRKNLGEKLCKSILSFWDKLSPWWEGETTADNQGLVILILTKLFLINGQLVSNSADRTFESFFEMYQKMLKNTKTTLGVKNQVLSLLPFFVTSQSQHEKKLKDALDRFIADHFPLKSTEFAEGTSMYKDYITAIDRILVAMEMTGSLMLLEVLISVYCREESHAHSEAIQMGIHKFIMRIPVEQQMSATALPFSVFLKEGSFPSNIRRAALENVCLPILRAVSSTAMVQFFSCHVQELIKILDVNLSRTSELTLENQLITKIGCFQLLEIMYARLSKDEVNSKSSVINQKFCNGKDETGKEMTQKITKCAHEARSEDIRGEILQLELRRQYHCHAHNLLIAIISCVQTELKFYKAFLFQDNISKGQFLLENLIDSNRQYEFLVELKSPMKRHKKIVSVRNVAREHRALTVNIDNDKDDDEVGIRASPSPSLHLASQYLADSSFNDDLNQFDFNMSNPGQNELYEPIVNIKTKLKASDENKATEAANSSEYIEMEMDDLNQHECMAPLIAVIKHMSLCKITPEVPGIKIPEEMPPWMVFLHEKMSSISSHLNIKLFIAKLVMNCGQPYAKFWLKPFCLLLMDSAVSGTGLSYLAVDLIITMITWHTAAIPADTKEGLAMASSVIRLIMDKIYHAVRQIYRSNLQLLKTVLEVWRDRVEIPYDLIFNLLKNADPKSMKVTTGIQVLGVVLTEKFPPYGHSAPVDIDKYLSTLSSCMNNSHKFVHAAAAEVVGLSLKWLAANGEVEKGNFLEATEVQLRSLASSKLDIFINCLHCIHLHYPPLSYKFLSQLLFNLPRLHGLFKTLTLEIILGHVDKMENAYLELKGKGFHEFLLHRDEDTQLVALKIVRAMMVALKSSECLSLLTDVASFAGHSNPACRKIKLDIFMWAYDNCRTMEDEACVSIMNLTKEALLKGLCDDDLTCRLVCQNFWSSSTRLPEGTLDRTISILEAMYSPSTEPHYLAYATNLLLEATSKSPDYQREIFEHALSECTFRDYSLHSSWRQRHAAMTPLFAATQVTQSMDLEQDSLDGGLRATQEVPQFTATMDLTGMSRAYNWLTQSSLDTYTEPSALGSGSQLLFKLGPEPQPGNTSMAGPAWRRAITDPARKTFSLKARLPGVSKSADDTDGPAQTTLDLWRLKRRFIKDQQTQSIFHARLHIKQNKLREEALKEQKARREHQVTLYRKYRIGDLPDIQIKYQYIIAPLQALAHRDSTVARLLFSSLFQAIFSEMDKMKTERESEELISQINNSIDNILSSSVCCFPPFIGSILTILYELRKSLKVSASNLGQCAVTSNQQKLAIIVLEEHLIIRDESREATIKRPRQNKKSPSPDLEEWIQLSRLYKSISDLDTVQGIFSDQLGTKEETKLAIEAEARGDYKTANNIYLQILGRHDWEDGDPLDAEVEFWDASRMECLDHLSQWKDLETFSVKGVDSSDQPNLNRVWDDVFYMDHYLPYVMRSKLKLLLSGDESQQPLLDFLDASLADPQNKQHLENRYCSELALIYLWQEMYDRARYYNNMSLQGFLQDWCSTTTLMVSCRKESLQNIQSLVELKEFLDSLGPNNKILPSVTGTLMKCWQGRLPDTLLDPVTIWDDVVHSRVAYADLIIDQMSMDVSGSDPDARRDLIDQLHQHQASLRLAMADSSQKQNNFSLTLRLLKDTQTMCKNFSNQELFVRWCHLYAEAHLSNARKSSGSWTGDMFDNVIVALDLLKKLQYKDLPSERPDLRREHQILTGNGFSILADGFLLTQETSAVKDDTMRKLGSLLSFDIADNFREKLISELIAKGYSSLKAAISQEDSGDPQDSVSLTPDEANLRLAKFCDKYLVLRAESKNLPENCNLDSFPETVVVCLLGAMKGGNEEARKRFPRLLQLLEQFSHVQDVFRRKVAEIPSWMFLMWVSQMTALLDKEESVVIAPVLTRIANDYPQALVYPLRMSSDGFNYTLGTTNRKEQELMKQRKETVDKLKDRTNHPLFNKFISALEQFAQPDAIFRDWCNDIRKLLSSSVVDKAKVKRKYQEIHNQLLNVKVETSCSSTQVNYSATGNTIAMGEFHKGFADNFKKEFDKKFGKDACKLMEMKEKDFIKEENNLRALIDGKRGLFEPPKKLKVYSPWLAEFNPKFGNDLEIPGQYTGHQKPVPEYHVKISGFDERVVVMASLRRPKRIQIRGNDQKDYLYLVKCGEDLRLDQRIELLFLMMNQVMTSDPACRQRKLQLKTYQVIPMTQRVGLIEWISNTCPLKSFLYDALSQDEFTFLQSDNGPVKLHSKWVNKLVNKADYGRWQKIYDEIFLKYSLTETVKEFRCKEGAVPWDLSRRAIHKMSSSPEAFHVLRSAMIRSHAVICICHYILGIGDRHLSNFMVDLRTGQMIGIDFGHAFGSATQFLPVPELMPFRLTRQLTNLALPLKVKGQMESTMQHVMRAMRADSDLLLRTMDIFVKEPHLDWLNFAERQKEGTVNDAEDVWYPEEKVKLAKHKLKGDHPSSIMIEELVLIKNRREQVYRNIVEVVKGRGGENIRASLPDSELTVEQQVSALIDQATDPNILGRTWQGWEPWF